MNTVTIKTFKFDELNKEAQEKAIVDMIDFEIEVMNEDSPYYEYALKMEKMKTPWFLGEVIYEKEKETIIETIRINEYDYLESGKFYYEGLLK